MKQNITPKHFRGLLIKLFEKIHLSDKQYTCVYGIANGGLHVSDPISKFFAIHHKHFYISFYDETKKLDVPKVPKYQLDGLNYYKSRKDYDNLRILWVDDIVDSGSTLKWFIDNSGLVKGKDFDVSTLHWCPENSPDLEPEFYIEKKNKDTWIVYPWEV